MSDSKRRKALLLGATGNFPRGKLNESDEGELRIAIGVQDKTLRIEFGKPVAWMAFDKAAAFAFAASIVKHANEM